MLPLPRVAVALLIALALRVIPLCAQPGTLTQVVPGVWFREGEIQQMGHCNNVIIEMNDHLIVVDANFPSGARATLADARKVSSKPVKYVLLTHHHWDHTHGMPVWAQLGAVMIAHAGVVDELNHSEPEFWQRMTKQRKDVAELNLPGPGLPQLTYQDKMVLQDNTRRVELLFLGWAHTRGDTFIYLPKEKVLCTGDAAVNGPYHYLANANIRNWPKVLGAALKLDAVHVLPGHGRLGGKEIIEGQAQFLLELQKAVQAALKQGKKAEDLDSIRLPDSVKNWVGRSLPGQLRQVYEELSQNRPYGEIERAR